MKTKQIVIFLAVLFFAQYAKAQNTLSEIIKLAESGNRNAQNELAIYYQNGYRVPDVDINKAFYWYKKAAEQNHPQACYLLGKLLIEETDDYKSAEKWLIKAADLSHKEAYTTLGLIYYHNYISSSIENDNNAFKYLSLAYESGDNDVLVKLGICYLLGRGTNQDYDKAISLFEKADYEKHMDKLYGYYLGCCYELGIGVTKDINKAFKYYSIGAESGIYDAVRALVLCHALGKGCDKDLDAASRLESRYFDIDSKEEWLDLRGEIYLFRGYKSGAEQIWDGLLRSDSTYPDKKTALYSRLFEEGINVPILSFGHTIKKLDTFPILQIDNKSIRFIDGKTSNNAIDANEECYVEFLIRNSGMGDGRNCIVSIDIQGEFSGIETKQQNLPTIKAGEASVVRIPIYSNNNTQDGEVAINVGVSEPNGFGTDPFTINVNTNAFVSPMLRVTDYAITGTTSTLQKKVPFNLQLMLQNVEYGEASDITVSLIIPDNVFILDGDEIVNFTSMSAGEVKSLEYTMVANNNYTSTSIPIQVSITEKYGKYAENRTIDLAFDQVFASNKISINEISSGQRKNIEIASLSSEVDKNIPITGLKNNNTFAIIIANENYQNDAKVDYALNDGRIFKEYCLKTLGIPESNIKLSPDATLNNLRNNISWIKDVASVYKGEAEIIFYYAGHGVPDDSSKEAFLLPVDGDGRLASQTGYSLKQLYSDLASCNTKSTLVFMDACFSGAQRNGQMLASARGVVIKAKDDAPQGNMVVFSAASAEQTAHQFADKRHGMFTYFLLKKLQETNGNVTLGELGNYIIDNVSKESIVRNSKLQTPTVTPSSVIGDWTNMKL